MALGGFTLLFSCGRTGVVDKVLRGSLIEAHLVRIQTNLENEMLLGRKWLWLITIIGIQITRGKIPREKRLSKLRAWHTLSRLDTDK